MTERAGRESLCDRHGRQRCAACPVWSGTCPRCGTYWLRRHDGKAFGFTVTIFGTVTSLASSEDLQGMLEADSRDPAWALFREAMQAFIDRMWADAGAVQARREIGCAT